MSLFALNTNLMCPVPCQYTIWIDLLKSYFVAVSVHLETFDQVVALTKSLCIEFIRHVHGKLLHTYSIITSLCWFIRQMYGHGQLLHTILTLEAVHILVYFIRQRCMLTAICCIQYYYIHLHGQALHTVFAYLYWLHQTDACTRPAAAYSIITSLCWLL